MGTDQKQFSNGLEGVVAGLFGQWGGYPGQGPGPQVAQTDTIMRNLRGYLLSNNRQFISQLYTEVGLYQNVCDVPVDDGLRGGVTITTKMLDEEEISKLQTWYQFDPDDVATEHSTDIHHGIVGQALKWNRCFGGAGIVIMTGQDRETPLEIDKIKEGDPLAFRACDMWELYMDRTGEELTLEQSSVQSQYYSYYGKLIHRSRVIPFRGIEPPSFVRPRLRGWGLSMGEALVRSINHYLKSNVLAFEVLDEYKVDIFKIKDLVTSLATADGEVAVQKRLQLAAMLKNFMNALVMDSDDAYDQKQLSFTGLAEIMKEIRIGVASDMRMPQLKLFGTSSGGGLARSGEDEIEVYNGMVESSVRHKAARPIVKILRLKAQQMYGIDPTDLKIEFKPLKVLSEKEAEEVKTQIWTRVQAAKTSGDITPKEYRDAINKAQLFPIKLDTSAAVLAEVETAQAEKLEAQMGPGPGGKKDDGERKNAIVDRTLLEQFPGPKIVTVGLMCNGQLLTGRRRDNGLWTCPGGHMDAGETVEAAACREVFEESGIMVTQDQLTMISAERFTSDRSGQDFVVFGFIAAVAKEAATTMQDPDQEIAEWRWVKVDPVTSELQPGSRHARNDVIVNHVLGIRGGA